jgi:hypothetical protein
METGSAPDAQAEGVRSKEIETASSVRQGRLDPLDAKIHPRAQARGCKVRRQPGIHHRPNRRCGTGATRGSIDGEAERLRDWGNPEDQSIGAAEGPKIWGNPESGPEALAREGDPGQPGDSSKAQPDGARTEVTRRSISRCRKIQDSGQPGNWSSAIPKD